jgi:hypothetical protein
MPGEGGRTRWARLAKSPPLFGPRGLFVHAHPHIHPPSFSSPHTCRLEKNYRALNRAGKISIDHTSHRLVRYRIVYLPAGTGGSFTPVSGLARWPGRSHLGRYCCKSLRTRAVQVPLKKHVGVLNLMSPVYSNRLTPHATRDVTSGVAMPVKAAFSSRQPSRRFRRPQFLDFCNNVARSCRQAQSKDRFDLIVDLDPLFRSGRLIEVNGIDPVERDFQFVKMQAHRRQSINLDTAVQFDKFFSEWR